MKRYLLLIIGLIGMLAIGFKVRRDMLIDRMIQDVYAFEYGEPIDIDNIKFDFSDILDKHDRVKVGKHKATAMIKYNGKIYERNTIILVEDTTAPSFLKFKDTAVWEMDDDWTGFLPGYEAKDFSGVEIEFDVSEVDFSKVGQYKSYVTARDPYNNETRKEISFKIIDSRKSLVEVNEAESNDVDGQVVVEKNKVEPNDVDDHVKVEVNEVEPYYVNGHVIVNKKYGIPRGFASGENPKAAKQIRALISEMKNLGMSVDGSYAGYRTYEHQNRLYTNYVKTHGQAAADISSAKPGYSEHQTGLAFDLRSPSGALLVTEPEVTWVRENAHRFGFIIRYPEGKTHITGYKYEPWHLRYMGLDAESIYLSGLTLEEYYEIP